MKVSSASDLPTMVEDEIREDTVIDPLMNGEVGNCIVLVSKLTLLQIS